MILDEAKATTTIARRLPIVYPSLAFLKEKRHT
jgi:hypothetical protein